jgi:hypothetical protein
VDRGIKLLWQSFDAKLIAIAVQHPEDEKISAPEHVPRETRPRVTQDRRDPRVFLDFRHVTRLATPLAPKTAVSPFQVRHLFWQPSDDLPISTKRFRVQRVTRRTQLGLPHVGRLARLELRGRHHDPRPAVIDLKWFEDGSRQRRPRCCVRSADD